MEAENTAKQWKTPPTEWIFRRRRFCGLTTRKRLCYNTVDIEKGVTVWN